MMTRSSAFSVAQHVLREPTFHFALLAGALFLAGNALNTYRPTVVEVDRSAVERRIREIERGRGVSLTSEERQLAEAAYVDELVLAKEARAGGLDDDERIRSILYQKMLHILSGEIVQPAREELRAFYEENRQRYSRPPTVDVDEMVVPGTSGIPPADVSAVKLDEASTDGVQRNTLTRVSADDLSWTYGAATAARVFAADPGEWVGPHRSGNGEHWFRVTERFAATPPPPLDAMLGQVRFDWIADNEAALLKQRVAQLRRRYSVRFTGESAVP
jgi:hypothetical protein